MADQHLLAATLRTFARTQVGGYQVDDVLHELCEGVVAVLGVDGAGVTIADVSGRLRFVVSTDDRVEHIETVQAATGVGPCQEAFVRREPMVVADLAELTEERWQPFAQGALAEGIRAVAGFPMVLEGQAVGALNVYRAEAGGFEPEDVEAAQLLADLATSLIMGLRRQHDAAEARQQLQQALSYRIVVEQAKGILAERHGISVAQARERLRSHARSNNRKVIEVAREVVGGALNV